MTTMRTNSIDSLVRHKQFLLAEEQQPKVESDRSRKTWINENGPSDELLLMELCEHHPKD
jgi:hypothetical protein